LPQLDAQYADVKARSTAHEAKLTALADIDKRRSEASRTLQQHKRDLAGLGDPEERHATLRAEMAALYKERSVCLVEQCETLTEQSGGLLSVEMRRGLGLRAVEEKFRGMVAGSGLRSDRLGPMFEELRKETDPITTWDTRSNRARDASSQRSRG